MMEELRGVLEAAGLPVGYRHLQDASGDYITYFIEDSRISASDCGGMPVSCEDSCVVELHTVEKEAGLEWELERLLLCGDLSVGELDKHEEYDYSECLFEITYRFKLRYKLR